MCGIGGMLGRPDEAVLHRINRLQRHRGPDGEGVWADERVGLAHTRLAILDLDGGQQPIVGQHGAVAVVNGEIYNHEHLREKYNIVSENKSDCQVIGHLYEQNGPEFIRELDGMFAFVIG